MNVDKRNSAPIFPGPHLEVVATSPTHPDPVLRQLLSTLVLQTELTRDEIIDQKLRDAETPGYEVAFDPDEAERIAFPEDALSNEDARESVEDL